MWTVEQWGVLLGVVAVVLTALAGMTKAIADLIVAWRKKDTSPAPQVGIPATAPAPAPAHDDIDIRAWEEMKKDRDFWRRLAMQRGASLDEDTQPIPPKET